MSNRKNNQRYQTSMHSQAHTHSQSHITTPPRANIKMNTSSRYPYTSSPMSTTLPHPFSLSMSMPMSSHPNVQFRDHSTSQSLFHPDESTFTLDTNKQDLSLQVLSSLLHLRTSSPWLESMIPSSSASTSSISETSESPISSPITHLHHQHLSPSRSRSPSCTRSRSSSPHSDMDDGTGIIARVAPPPPDSTTTKRHAIKKYGTVVNAMQLDVSQVSALQRKVASLRKKRKHAPGSGNYQRKRQNEDEEEDILIAEPVTKQVESPIKRQRVLPSSSVSKSSSSSSLSSLPHSLPPTPTPTDDIHPFRQLISRLKRRHLLAYHRLAADAAQQHLKSMTSDDTHITITPTTPSSHQHGISPTPMGTTSPIPLLGSHGSAFAGMKSQVISPTPISTPSTPGFSSFPSSTLPPFSYPTSSTSRPFPMSFPGKRTSNSSTSSGLSPFSLSSFNMSPVPVAVM